jgi:hypothetical protein
MSMSSVLPPPTLQFTDEICQRNKDQLIVTQKSVAATPAVQQECPIIAYINKMQQHPPKRSHEPSLRPVQQFVIHNNRPSDT